MFCHVSFRFGPTLLVNSGCDHIACLRLMSSGDLVGALGVGGSSFFLLNEYFYELNPRKNPVLNIVFELNPRKKTVLNIFLNWIQEKIQFWIIFLNWICSEIRKWITFWIEYFRKKILNNFWIEYFWEAKFWIFF